jgi:hypothetical protein
MSMEIFSRPELPDDIAGHWMSDQVICDKTMTLMTMTTH